MLNESDSSETSHPNPRLGRGWLAVALGIALTLQIVTVARSPLTAPDSFGFIQYARELSESPAAAVRSQPQHPGFPLLILAAHGLTEPLIAGDAAWLAAARLACGLSGLACVCLVWMITRHVADPSIAGAAAVLFALLPTIRQNASDGLSDQPHLMLYLGAVLLVCQATTLRSLGRFLLAGAVSGAAFCVRPEGLAVALVAAFGVVITPAWRTQLGTRRACAASCALLAGAAVLVAPYVLTSGQLTGKLRYKPGWAQAEVAIADASSQPSPHSLDGPREPPVPPPAIPAPAIPLTGPTPWNDPLPSALLAAVARFCTRLAESLNGILLVPLLLGIPLAVRRMQTSSVWFFVMLALAQIGLLLLLYRLAGYIDRRHLIPLLAILMPSIGAGALMIVRWLRAVGNRRPWTRWALPAAVACTLAILVPRAVRPLHQNHLHLLEAAAWLREHSNRGDTIGSDSMEVVYHATADGRARPGSVFHAGVRIDADGPLLRNTFLAVELDEHNALPEWSHGIPPEFSPVTTIQGDRRLHQRDIVIYQRIETVRTADALHASGGRVD